MTAAANIQTSGKKIRTYPHKTISYREVNIGNQLFQKDPGLSIQLGADRYSIHLEPAEETAPLNIPLQARVKLDDHIVFELCPEVSMLQLMITDIATAEDLRTLSPELRTVVLESALERILDRIDQISGAHSTIDRLSVNPKNTKNRLQIYFSLIRTKDAVRRRGYLRTDMAGLQWIAARIGRLTAKSTRRFDHLPFTGRIEMAEMVLPHTEVSGLESNDIILTDEPVAWEDRHLRVRFSPWLALGGNMVEPDRILIQEVINGKRDKMQQTKDLKPQSAELPVDDIPVHLVFEIGRTEIALEALKHLQPGYTIQLDESINIDKPITIRANGIVLGSGEIVLIDDIVGIRVLNMKKDI